MAHELSVVPPVNLFIALSLLAVSIALLPVGSESRWPVERPSAKQQHRSALPIGDGGGDDDNGPSRSHHHQQQRHYNHHNHHQHHHQQNHKMTAAAAHRRHHRRAIVVDGGEQATLKGPADERGAEFKRRALDLAVNRLHILESLDEQLRAFAERSHPSAGRRRLPQLCLLRPLLSEEVTPAGDDGPPNCLAERRLSRQIPPYMLNLYRQLHAESRSLADAVRLMPYQSLVVRSFRQPALNASVGLQRRRVDEQDAATVDDDDDDNDNGTNELVVELSALAADDHVDDDGAAAERKVAHEGEWRHDDHDRTAQRARNLYDGRRHRRRRDERGDLLTATQAEMGVPACDLSQRALPAHERSDLCYWFQISEQLRMKINGSLLASAESSSSQRERLVEAELHVFKLAPELLQAANEMEALRRRQTRDNNSSTTTTTSSSSHLYHLKTSLLEVSLYQILPKKTSGASPDATSSFAGAGELDKDFPLRLLDIRRIDLDSGGWETFYVKRAVDDWVRDARSNLGLVIKAKSMFEEPIRIGWIRFADAYDHRQQLRHNSEQRQLEAVAWTRDKDAAAEFDSSHQPMLVIYTTAATTTPTPAPATITTSRAN